MMESNNLYTDSMMSELIRNFDNLNAIFSGIKTRYKKFSDNLRVKSQSDVLDSIQSSFRRPEDYINFRFENLEIMLSRKQRRDKTYYYCVYSNNYTPPNLPLYEIKIDESTKYQFYGETTDFDKAKKMFLTVIFCYLIDSDSIDVEILLNSKVSKKLSQLSLFY